MLAQVLGVPVGALSRLELCNTGQEAELRRRALDDPDVIVPLTLAFRHAVDARKHRAWWSSEAAAADGVHDWFRPEPQLVWRLKLMRALCSPLSHPACARAAAAAELPAMLLEVPPPTSCTCGLCTTAPKPLTPVSMYVCTSASRLPPLCAAACTFPHASARTSTSTSACRCCGLATRWCEERGGPLRRPTLSAASPPSPPTPTGSSSSKASYRSCAPHCAGTRAHATPMRHAHAPRPCATTCPFRALSARACPAPRHARAPRATSRELCRAAYSPSLTLHLHCMCTAQITLHVHCMCTAAGRAARALPSVSSRRSACRHVT